MTWMTPRRPIKAAICSVVVVATELFQVVHGGAAEGPGTGAPVMEEGGPPVEKAGFERTLANAVDAIMADTTTTATDRRHLFIVCSFPSCLCDTTIFLRFASSCHFSSTLVMLYCGKNRDLWPHLLIPSTLHTISDCTAYRLFVKDPFDYQRKGLAMLLETPKIRQYVVWVPIGVSVLQRGEDVTRKRSLVVSALEVDDAWLPGTRASSDSSANVP